MFCNDCKDFAEEYSRPWDRKECSLLLENQKNPSIANTNKN